MDIPSLYYIFQKHPSISTDTRKIKPDSIFFALKGEHFDGNTFAIRALEQGAAYAVVSDPLLNYPGCIHVADTLLTLQSLAIHHRRQLNIPVLAITGSNGKTTTKELLSAVLSRKYKVHATPGNFNNHIGVPLTLLGVRADHEFVVCEMGANHSGEIAQLCKIAEPTHGLITNIGKAHLEGFGSIEGVKKAKGELFDYLRAHQNIAFVNTDDLRLRDLGKLLQHKITYGFDPTGNPQNLFSYSIIPGETGFTLNDTQSPLSIHSTMLGQYNAMNMLAAYVAGKQFGVDQEAIADALSRFVSSANRSEMINLHGCIIVKDAYNANPSSMELAVKAFTDRYPGGWLVLGDMKELGEESIAAHQQIIDILTSSKAERIFLVGASFTEAFQLSGVSDHRFVTAETIHALRNTWDWEACNGKAILLKGSRSMQLELLLDPQ